MSYEEVLGQQVIAISISESPDMPALGLSDGTCVMPWRKSRATYSRLGLA